jgi:cytoskeletal protein CcmA (bactofilin family)
LKPLDNKSTTLISADTHITGDVKFSGVLHLQGTINGAGTCEADADGLMVIDRSGTLTGSLSVPRVIVHGHMSGPVTVFKSLTVSASGRIDGDIEYAAIELRAEGVSNGVLTPFDGRADAVPRNNEVPLRIEEDRGRRRRHIVAAVIVVAAVAITPIAVMRFRDVEPSATTNAVAAAALAPVNSDLEATPPPVTPALSQPLAQVTVSPSGIPESTAMVNPDPPAIIEGVNPAKPSDVVLVIASEAAVLFKKRRDEPEPGTRIGLVQGGTKTIAIARDDILRVEQGPDIELLYQGRKVAPKMVRSGQWLRFTPHPRSRVTSGTQ